MYEASSEARNENAAAMSAGEPSRPIGTTGKPCSRRALADDERRGEDDGDHLLPRLVLHVEERLLRPRGGVRDDDVEPARVLVGLADGAVALAHLGQVGLDRRARDAQPAELAGDA